MTSSIRQTAFSLLFGFMASGLQAQAANPATYILTLTNGSSMPLSSFVVYTQTGQVAKSRIGVTPSMGFVQLCQTGNPTMRLQELGMS